MHGALHQAEAIDLDEAAALDVDDEAAQCARVIKLQPLHWKP